MCLAKVWGYTTDVDNRSIGLVKVLVELNINLLTHLYNYMLGTFYSITNRGCMPGRQNILDARLNWSKRKLVN